MTRIIRGVAIMAVLLATPLPAFSQRALTPEQWRSDLRFLASELPKRHRDAFHKLSRARFDSAVAALDAKLPKLTDHEALVGLVSIVALVGDGHTRLTLPQDHKVGFDRAHTPTDPPSDSSLFMHHFPIRYELFEDGLYVRAATAEHQHLIGARVLRIGTMRTDSALEAVRPAAHYDNEQGFRLMAPTMLPVPEILHAVGIARETSVVTIVVEKDGRTSTVALKPLQLWAPAVFIEARDLLPRAPHWERDVNSWYWLDYMPAERTVYVQVNRINASPDENMNDFARRVRQTFHERGAERVVIDLRHNPGGNGSVVRPLFTAMVRDSAINQFGRLFLLIGRETFSAAQFLVNDMEHAANALFIGEPTGGSPSGYGDSRKFKLPNSGLTVRASTIYWRDQDGDEKKPWTVPHIPVVLTAGDYFSGKDPVLHEAATFNSSMSPAALVRLVQQRSDWPQAMHICWAYVSDPMVSLAARESGAAACGLLLQEKGETKVAVGWFQALTQYLPDEPFVYRGLAAALKATGNETGATEALAKASALETSRARR